MIDSFLPCTAGEAASVNAIVLSGSMVESRSPIIEKLGELVELTFGEAV
jgi:hypothetical protein